MIITIPKPGKLPSLSSSCRPILLFCPAVKALESLLLPHLTAAIPLSDSQHAIDFSKAFDTVPNPELISQISSLPLNRHIIHWLVCYLKGRSAKCSNHDQLSSSRSALSGIPQGSVISPALFNLFVSDYPSTAPLITSYTDDFTAIATTSKS
ncbi:Reverse transcriptase domain [Trinorchestia longiramus]|nr:Reverse transcriptase domain [Trinorchestia longiramus]